MKTASVRELRNHYTTVMKWIEAGEEVKISKRGKVIARLVPEKPKARRKVDWSTSAAVLRDRSGERILSAEESAALLAESQGKW
jgi:antitoxin (DNA-binding transcriptional repressor) of toxin-antitoxin stability system